jgi:hypothetical protein
MEIKFSFKNFYKVKENRGYKSRANLLTHENLTIMERACLCGRAAIISEHAL